MHKNPHPKERNDLPNVFEEPYSLATMKQDADTNIGFMIDTVETI
jgi:hypothetical protein